MDDRAVTRIGKRESGNLQARFGFMTTPCLSVKKGRPNCGGPSEVGKRPAGDDGRSHSKASKPLRCCDTRLCGRHGTRSASRLMTHPLLKTRRTPNLWWPKSLERKRPRLSDRRGS